MAAVKGKNLVMLQSIERLSGADNDWAVMMKAYLEHEDLFDTIMPSENEAAVNTDATKMRLARTKLVLSVDRIVLSQIEGLNSPKAIWETLQSTYASKSLYRKTSLIIEYTRIRLEDCDSTEQYIDCITTIHQKLKDIGKDLGDDFAACIMLGGLPEEYEPMRMALESMPEKEITTANIKAKLLLKVKWEKPTHGSSELGLYAANNNKRGRRFQRGERWGDNRAKPSYSNAQCYRCNRYSHIAKQCNMPDTRQQRTQQQANHATQDEKEENERDDDQIAAFAFVGLAAGSKASSGDWIVDSGALRHMCNSRCSFTHMRKSSLKYITVADRGEAHVLGEDEVKIHLENGTEIKLLNVLLVPDITVNLVSVSEASKRNFNTIFSEKSCKIIDRNVNVAIKAILEGGIFKIICKRYSDDTNAKRANDTHNIRKQQVALAAHGPATPEDMDLWHRRLAHLNHDYVKQLSRRPASGIHLRSEVGDKCEVCVLGKMCRKPFHRSESRAGGVLDLVHTDLCYITPQSQGGAKYFLTFLDDYSRKCFTYFLKSKNQVYSMFVLFKNYVENNTNRKIKCLQSDNGTKYINFKMQQFLDQHGIQRRLSIPGNPQQNGRAERINRTLLDKARCLIHEANLDKSFWAEA